MKIVFLANAADIHTARWVNALSGRGLAITLLTLQPPQESVLIVPEVRVVQLRYSGKMGYYLNAPQVRRLLREIQPDLLHAHYATGYGTLARLTKFHPAILSVWGSDVLDFPAKSRVHRYLLKKNLAYADFVASTSRVMAAVIQHMLPLRNEITLTPFGVDCEHFKPASSPHPNPEFIVGMVKKLEQMYGVDYLIEAFAIVRQSYKGPKKLRLRIVGRGGLETKLKSLVQARGLAEVTEFTGHIQHSHLPRVFNGFSVAVALSRTESFGVSVLEASACGIPVVVSRVGGLPEVVEDKKTGFIVEPSSPESAAAAILQLLNDSELAEQMGRAGRQFVLEKYEWADSVERMLELYRLTLRQAGKTC